MIENTLPEYLIIIYSSIYIVAFFSVINLLPKKASRIILLVGYVFISILMFIDSVYYSHFGNLTSVSLIYQLKVLDDISGSVFQLISFNHILLLIDTIIVVGLVTVSYNDGYEKISDFTNYIPKRKKPNLKSLSIPIVIMIFLLASSGIVKSSPLIIDSFRKEYFSHHIRDIYYNYLAVPDLKYKEKDIDEFFSNHIAEEAKISTDTPYYGIAQGKNLVNIQLESISEILVTNEYNGQLIMPNLNALLHKDSLYFNNYYQQMGKGGTSDAEFSTMTSQYPSAKDITLTYFYKNDFYALPKILKENGYSETMAFHGYDGTFWNRKNAYPALGIDKFYDQDFFKSSKKVGWNIGDEEMFQQTIPVYENSENPFFAHIVTLSSHHPFYLPYAEVTFDDFKLKKEHKETTFGRYLLAAHYVDKSIGEYIETLKEKGLYNNIVFTLYGDHSIINKTDKESSEFISKELLDGKLYEEDTIFKVPLIVHIPNSNINETISNIGSFIDYSPTMLYLLGLENHMKAYFGKNILFENSTVVFDRWNLPNSIITPEMVFISSKESQGYDDTRAWNKQTGEKLDLEKSKSLVDKEVDVYNISDYIFEKNYMKKYLK